MRGNPPIRFIIDEVCAQDKKRNRCLVRCGTRRGARTQVIFLRRSRAAAPRPRSNSAAAADAPVRGDPPSLARRAAGTPLRRTGPDFRQAAQALRRPPEKSAFALSQHARGVPAAAGHAGGVLLRRRRSPSKPIRRGRNANHLPARPRRCRVGRFRRPYRALSNAPVSRLLRIALQGVGALPVAKPKRNPEAQAMHDRRRADPCRFRRFRQGRNGLGNRKRVATPPPPSRTKVGGPSW